MKWGAAFDELELGDAFDTPSRMITEQDVAAFAALTGDHHPAHTDARWAAAGPFGERMAHGLLTLSCAVGLTPLDPERVLALRRVGEVVFKRPVILGDTIRVRGKIVGLRAAGETAGLVSCRWAIVNQHDALCVRAEVEILWRRDAAATAAPVAGGGA